MQYFSTLGEIKVRADAIRLPIGRLARMRGVAVSTATRGLADGSGIRAATLKNLGDGLIAEEQRLLRHLIAIHGVPDSQGPKA